jgi:hypothetical protein
MPAKTQPKKVAQASSGTTTTKRRAAGGKQAARAGRTVKRTADLSDEVMQELEQGANSALEAVRKFLSTVDEALPSQGDGPSRREEIADSALVMAQQLVHTQAEFLRKVVESAGKTLTSPSKRR